MSSLQKSILLQAYEQKRKRLLKKAVDAWYAQLSQSRAMSYRDAQNTVTKTIENLIDKGCMVGYGVRTPKKWFIHEVRLTPDGRRIGKRLRGVQQALPLATASRKP